jgi:hypothetical protein
MIFYENGRTMFESEEHYSFYIEKVEKLNPDVYLRALIYAVGICPDTRRRWQSFYDEADRSIKPEVINEGWQTGTTYKITRLAYQLFTDGTPTAVTYDEKDNQTEDFKECSRYSVSDIFCCEYAPFFVEAIKLRYPEYFSSRNVYTEEKRLVDQLRSAQEEN